MSDSLQRVYINNVSDEDIFEEVSGRRHFIPAGYVHGPVDKTTWNEKTPGNERRYRIAVMDAKLMVLRHPRGISIDWDSLSNEVEVGGMTVYHTHEKGAQKFYWNNTCTVLEPYTRIRVPEAMADLMICTAQGKYSEGPRRKEQFVFEAPHVEEGEFLAKPDMGLSELRRLGRAFGLSWPAHRPAEFIANEINHFYWQLRLWTTPNALTAEDMPRLIKEGKKDAQRPARAETA